MNGILLDFHHASAGLKSTCKADCQIQEALKHAGIGTEAENPLRMHDDNSYAWLDNGPILDGLRMIAPAVGEKKRNYGGLPLFIHQLWGAHQCFNDPRIKELGIDPYLAAFIFAVHDNVEELRSHARKNNLPFNEGSVLTAVTKLWPLKEDRPLIYEVTKWMTDDETLHGPKRIEAQIAKCFDENRKCIVDPLFQIIRETDKLHHILMDALMRKMGFLPDSSVYEAYRQGCMKAYTLGFDVASSGPTAGKYVGGLNYLGDQTQFVANNLVRMVNGWAINNDKDNGAQPAEPTLIFSSSFAPKANL